MRSKKFLLRKRLADERKFARLKPREQARIVLPLIKSTIYLLCWVGVLFIAIAIIFDEWNLLLVTGVCWVLAAIFFGYLRLRLARFRKYYTIARLQKMNPYDFEEYVIHLCNKLGFKLAVTPASGDDGADGIWKNPKGHAVILQVKRFADSTKVGSPDIRDFIWSMRYHGVSHWIFVTTGHFSGPAITTAQEVKWDFSIELIDQDMMIRMIEKAWKKKS